MKKIILFLIIAGVGIAAVAGIRALLTEDKALETESAVMAPEGSTAHGLSPSRRRSARAIRQTEEKTIRAVEDFPPMERRAEPKREPSSKSLPAVPVLEEGVRLLASGRSGEAIDRLTEALREQPDNADVKVLLGFAQLEADNTTAAEDWFGEVIERDPKNPHAHYGMAQIKRQRGDVDGAVDALNKTLATDPSHLDAKLDLANLYTFEKRAIHPMMEVTYREVLQQDPGNPEARNGLATVLMMSQKSEEAVTIWQQMATEEPDNSDLLSNLAEAHMRSGHLDEAYRTAEQASQKNPDNGAAYYLMGVVEMNQNSPQRARTLIEEALARDPNNTTYKEALKDLDAPSPADVPPPVNEDPAAQN